MGNALAAADPTLPSPTLRRTLVGVTRYIIIGAGAIGGGIAGLLADAGVDVVAVARGEHAAAIQASGLTIRTPERAFTATVACVTSASELSLTTDDVLVLTTKTHQAEEALRPWVDVRVTDAQSGEVVGTAGETLPLLTGLNGVSAEGIALRFFARVLGVCVWMPAVHLVPGEVIVRGTPTHGTFHVGPYPVGADESAVLDAVERDWTSAGFLVERPADVMPWKYRKLISNIGNAFQALVGTNGSPSASIKAAQDEARQVLADAGIEVTSDEQEAAARASSFDVAPVPGEPEQLGGSSWQSLTRGTGTIETDYLNGEIARVARQHGLAAPINTAVASLARQAAASGAKPGDLSADQLATALGLPSR